MCAKKTKAGKGVSGRASFLLGPQVVPERQFDVGQQQPCLGQICQPPGGRQLGDGRLGGLAGFRQEPGREQDLTAINRADGAWHPEAPEALAGRLEAPQRCRRVAPPASYCLMSE